MLIHSYTVATETSGVAGADAGGRSEKAPQLSPTYLRRRHLSDARCCVHGAGGGVDGRHRCLPGRQSVLSDWGVDPRSRNGDSVAERHVRADGAAG